VLDVGDAVALGLDAERRELLVTSALALLRAAGDPDRFG
jgi:hypothetical protein